MSLKSTILGLLGHNPEMRTKEARFEGNLRRMDAADKALDDLLQQIKDVDSVVEQKRETIAESSRPPDARKSDPSASQPEVIFRNQLGSKA